MKNVLFITILIISSIIYITRLEVVSQVQDEVLIDINNPEIITDLGETKYKFKSDKPYSVILNDIRYQRIMANPPKSKYFKMAFVKTVYKNRYF